jgi:hypothetical protein
MITNDPSRKDATFSCGVWRAAERPPPPPRPWDEATAERFRQAVILADPEYLFLHRTFQEYLTARALARRANAKPKCQARIVRDFAERQRWLPDWREVIVLLAGLLDDPLPLLQARAEPHGDDIARRRLALAGLGARNLRLPRGGAAFRARLSFGERLIPRRPSAEVRHAPECVAAVLVLGIGFKALQRFRPARLRQDRRGYRSQQFELRGVDTATTVREQIGIVQQTHARLAVERLELRR